MTTHHTLTHDTHHHTGNSFHHNNHNDGFEATAVREIPIWFLPFKSKSFMTSNIISSSCNTVPKRISLVTCYISLSVNRPNRPFLCLKTMKNTSVSHTVALGDMFITMNTHTFSRRQRPCMRVPPTGQRSQKVLRWNNTLLAFVGSKKNIEQLQPCLLNCS